jgi:hypothetical protein
MPYNTINSRWGRSRRRRVPSPPSNSIKSAYKNKMNNNKTSRIKRRTKKNSLRKRWANTLKGKSPLPKAGSPRKQRPMDRYTELKKDENIGITTIPNKIFTEAPPIDDLSKLRQILINKTESPAVIKLIQDDMVRIILNNRIPLRIRSIENFSEKLHEGYNDYLFTEDDETKYYKLFQTTKAKIQKESESVFQ